MKPMCQIIHNKGGYEGEIPSDAPLEFRWGYQGVRTAFRILQFEHLLGENCTDVDPDAEKIAHEKCREAKFSCQYGRLGKPRLRKVVELAEEKGIARRDELRSLIQHGDMFEKDERIQVRSSKLWWLLAAIYMTLCFMGAGAMTYLVYLSPISMFNKFIGMGVYISLFLGCGYAMYASVFRPYKLAKQLGPDLEALDKPESKPPKFTIVKDK